MSDVNALLNERLNKAPKASKMTALAHRSVSGDLNGFTGIFGVSELSNLESATLENILHRFATDNVDIQQDLQLLTTITSEVKAITNQAAILHGERIKRAHDILVAYRDGAFTAWLIAIYGNRQTPYNLWHYYEFHQATPKELRGVLEKMPRQAIYTLASREGSFEKKQGIVKRYAGESKRVLLDQIRNAFPLNSDDQRAESPADVALRGLERVHRDLSAAKRRLSAAQKRRLVDAVDAIRELLQ